MSNSMMMRRRLELLADAPPPGPTPTAYTLLPEADGRIEKAKIPFSAGCHIHMEWDTSKLHATRNDSVLSFYRQAGLGRQDINPVPNITSYSIISRDINRTVYEGGVFDCDPPVDGNLFVGYREDSDTVDRRISGDYIRITIS